MLSQLLLKIMPDRREAKQKGLGGLEAQRDSDHPTCSKLSS